MPFAVYKLIAVKSAHTTEGRFKKLNFSFLYRPKTGEGVQQVLVTKIYKSLLKSYNACTFFGNIFHPHQTYHHHHHNYDFIHNYYLQ